MACVIFSWDRGYTKELQMLDDFIYEGNANFPYPTCSLGKGMTIPSSNESALPDFTFLSAVAYLDPNITQDALNNWFKNGTAIDQNDAVKNFTMNTKKIKRRHRCPTS